MMQQFGSLEEFQEEFRDINQEEQVGRLHKMLAPHLLRSKLLGEGEKKRKTRSLSEEDDDLLSFFLCYFGNFSFLYNFSHSCWFMQFQRMYKILSFGEKTSFLLLLLSSISVMGNFPDWVFVLKVSFLIKFDDSCGFGCS
jgi:hypothetical protein